MSAGPRVCVVGAGAIGGVLAGRLARADVAVSVLARGATLAALASEGVTVQDRAGSWTTRPRASGEAQPLGAQDVVVFSTKAHALPAAVAAAAPLIGPETLVVTAVNGIPWWYFEGLDGRPGPDAGLASVDPGRSVASAIPPARSVACVLHLGASVEAPGRYRHAYGNRLVLGTPRAGEAAAAHSVATILEKAGFKAEVPDDIRAEVWRKLLSNIAINPVSLILGQPCDAIASDPRVMRMMGAMMTEALAVAARFGTPLAVDIARQLAGFAAIGAFRTSMLQDLDAGRPVELDPILGAVVEMAELGAVPVPLLGAVYALARARAAASGCYHPIAARGAA